jgi:hypothetical protein
LSGAGDESMQLESQEGTITGTAALSRWHAHKSQHGLQSQPAGPNIATSRRSQTVCRFRDRHRRATSEALTILQTDFELYPDCKGVQPERIVIEFDRDLV